MEINKIIFACDDSHFLEYWPIQSKICKEVLGIEPVLFRITDNDSDFYYDDYGLVKNIKKIERVNSGAQAAIGRMFFTKYFQDEVCVVSDIDMLMIDKNYLKNQIKDFDDDSLIIYISDAYDTNRPEAKEYVNRDYFEKNIGDLYPYYLNAAKGKVFNKILGTDCNFSEYIDKHKEIGSKTLFWGVDECYFSKCVNTKNHNIKVEKLVRGYNSEWKCNGRIERHRFPVELSFTNEIKAQKKEGVYDFKNLKKDKIIEINLPRPYSKYKQSIDEVIRLIVETNSNTTNKKIKNSKKIALISTYCDTQEKKDVFLDLVKNVKSLGIDVMAISPLPLDKEHIESCDYVFFTKENPILGWPTRLFTFWKEFKIGDGQILTFQRGVGDYSWAALYHVKKLTQIAMDYDYDIFYHMIYDLEFDENVKSALENFQGNVLYPRRDPNNPEVLWETTLHLMSFDRDMMGKIEKEITLKNYLSTDGVAEGEVLKWKNKFNLKGSETPVKDKIYYWKDYDFFDYSPTKDFKMFFSKNDNMDIWLGVGDDIHKEILPNNLRMVFYGNQNIGEVGIIVNDLNFNIKPKSFEFIDIPINSKEIKTIFLEYQNKKYDLSDEYQKVMLNQIYINNKNW